METFLKIFHGATANIPQEYFQLPVAGREDPIYRERVYCYELYHQIRLRWPKNYPYLLSGEIDKNGHPIIRGNELDYTKPDFLVHIPGKMNRNLLVMEVKSIDVKKDGVDQDLTKLNAYRQFAEYQNAIYLIYGDSWQNLLKMREIVNSFASSDREETININLIQLWYHPSPGESAIHIPWEDEERQ